MNEMRAVREMTRLEALVEVRERLSSFENYLQGGYLKEEKKPHPFDIAMDFDNDVKEANDLVNACDALGELVNAELEKALKDEEEAAEERGETMSDHDKMVDAGHSNGDF